MAEKPTTAAGYEGEHTELVRATCLYVATRLGDVLDDMVVIGGLVPSLLIDQDDLSDGVDAHVGTMDLDVGLTIALLGEGRYRTLPSGCATRGLNRTQPNREIQPGNAGRLRHGRRSPSTF